MEHAVIESKESSDPKKAAKYTIKDLDSTNGTYVDDLARRGGWIGTRSGRILTDEANDPLQRRRAIAPRRTESSGTR